MGARKIIRDLAGHPRVLERRRNLVCPQLGPAFKLAQHDQSVIQMLNHPGGRAVQADKAKSPQNLFRWEKPRQLLFIAQTILQRHHGGARTDQGRQQLCKLRVRRRLERDQHHVAHADFIRQFCAMRPRPKIARRTANLHPTLPHNFVIRPQQEIHVVSGVAKYRPVIAAHGATSDDDNFHGWNGKQKRHSDKSQSAFVRKVGYLAPKIASLAALATRNFTTRLAAI